MRQGTEQSGSGESQPRSGSRGHIKAARVRVQKLEAALLVLATCQSCPGRTSVECGGRPVPTVHQADCEVHQGVGQEGGNGCNDCSRKPLQAQTFSDRSMAPDTASEVVRLQDQVAHFHAQLATRLLLGSMPQWFVPMTMCWKVRRRKVECDHVSDSGEARSVDQRQARQSDIQDAVTTGNATKSAGWQV